MSLILKGIDLPKGDTAEIIIRIQPNGEVRDSHGILLDVEAIQIPKGHGRLKDADKLRTKFNRTESGYCGSWEFCDKPEDFQFLIDDEPTILEAEE